MKTLNPDFIFEVFKGMLIDRKFLQMCRNNFKHQYLPSESYKKVLQHIYNTYDLTQTPPTMGVLGQTFNSNTEILNILTRVHKIQVGKEELDELTSTLEFYIKDSRFRILYEKLGDLYNEGKQTEALKLLQQESELINEFNLKDSTYSSVFKGFEERQDEREKQQNNILLEKLTFGIHELDDHTRGGFNKGTSVLILGRSGGGKSTFLRWIALCNARLGRRVVHFQGEGTELECLNSYDAGWTSINLDEIELGEIPSSKRDKIYKTQRDILATGGEIFVYASEQFDELSINDCREKVIEIESLHGKVDLVIFDYLEVFTVKGQFGNSEASERKRRQDIANKITNIAIEFKCGTVTAIQANDILPEKYNNGDFVMTRSHISEFKGAIKPFSYFLTLNQTDDEAEAQILRIYEDKFRKYKSKRTVYIYQSLENSRFYNSQKTLAELYTK